MKKIIVTGITGFVGRYLATELVKMGYEVIGICRKKIQMENVRIVECPLEEISKLEKLISDRDIEACIHLAWAGSTGSGRTDEKLQLSNVYYSIELIRVLARMGVMRFVGVGTLAEKEVCNYSPNDGATPNLTSFYGVAKITAHFMTKAECSSLKMEHIWCQLSNLYGIGDQTNNFVNFATDIFLNGKRASLQPESNTMILNVRDAVQDYKQLVNKEKHIQHTLLEAVKKEN